MTDLSATEVLTQVGMRLVLASIECFANRAIDNEDYIPFLKSTIEEMGSSAEELIDTKTGDELRKKFRVYARDLFVKLWLEQATEDGNASKNEREIAQKTFDGLFDRS